MPHPLAARLAGTGSYVPPRVVTNAVFADTLDTSDEWITTRTGIRERRYAGPGETTSSMAILAAKEALHAAGQSADDVDLIVVGTVTPDMMCPSVAGLVQAGLGCRPIPAFDVTAACSGFLYAVGVGDSFVRSGASKTALVIGADTITRVADYTDRNTCILFGDGAGAVVLTADRTAGPSGRVWKVRLFCDGTRQELVQVPSTVTPNPPPGSGLPSLRFLRMSGREVFKFAVQKLSDMIRIGRQDCQEFGLPDLSLVVPHQVNRRIIDAAIEGTGFPAERVMMNLEKYGNTSAASVPIAFDEAVREGRCQPGDSVLLVAFGGGLTWSSALVTV